MACELRSARFSFLFFSLASFFPSQVVSIYVYFIRITTLNNLSGQSLVEIVDHDPYIWMGHSALNNVVRAPPRPSRLSGVSELSGKYNALIFPQVGGSLFIV